MKRTIITLTLVVAAFVLAILLGSPKAHTFSSATAIAAPAPAPFAEPLPARCPRIHEARARLEEAEQELREGAHDFCGHKVDAMRAVHAAIEQLRMAENCDRCR
jgi:hypothetical protein